MKNGISKNRSEETDSDKFSGRRCVPYNRAHLYIRVCEYSGLLGARVYGFGSDIGRLLDSVEERYTKPLGLYERKDSLRV